MLKLRYLAAAIAALSSTANAASYGGGTSYDRNEGEYVGPIVVSQALSGIELQGSTLVITGGSADDTASVEYGSLRGQLVAKRGAYQATYSTLQVTKIVFYGNDGNDHFTNSTSIPSELNGGDGNDVLYGGGGADFLIGGLGQDVLRGYGGNDTIWGSGGSDWLYGGEGNDLVKGHGGNDQINGDNGTDALYGGSGDDTIWGGALADTIATIGGGYDTVYGGTGNDFFWVDTTDNVADVTATETSEKFVNKVSSFYSISYSGGNTSTPVAKDLTDFDLPDPMPTNWDVDLENFADKPLFGSAGPNKEDVLQGGVGDCYILGPLAAVADATPDSIRKLVVDLDDGTYAVRLFRTAGSPEFVRVDADLWVDEVTGDPEYAQLGLYEETIWLPIVEKAWALFRRQEGTYASISGGNGEGSGVTGMGADNSIGYEITAWYDADDIIAWVNAGRPAGSVASYVNSTVPALLNWIADQQDLGFPIYTGNISGASDMTSFAVDNWRRGQHIIMVDHVNFDANGNPISLTLRDQYGPTYRTLTDFARIYFLIGRAYHYDMP